MQFMFLRMLSALLIISVLPRDCFAQSLTSVQPRSVRPGTTTRLTLTGKNLGESLRVITSVATESRIESIEAEKAIVDLTLPPEMPLGPLGLWITTSGGVSNSTVLLVDDLASVVEDADNHQIDQAQKLSPPTALDGVGDGPESDFFRFQVEAGQRIAFEVLTQSIGSKFDPVVRLFDSDGQQLYAADDDEVGPECRFEHVFAEAGDYVLQIRDSGYVAGNPYHLRMGDFPRFDHAYPLAVQRGHQAKVQFATADLSQSPTTEVLVPDAFRGRSYRVAARYPEGTASAWASVAVRDFPQYLEAETQVDALVLPVGISGRLSEPKQSDEYLIKGVKGKTFRFHSLTRSLRSRTLLQLQLVDANGKTVARTEVADTDEWSFDYAFPDDGVYRLKVNDLLHRGGVGFGYLIEIVPGGSFELAWKADAKLPEQFPITEQDGAFAVDLQIKRSGYDGQILLSLDPSQPGLKILNPVVPAKAKEARVYVSSDSGWTSASLVMGHIVGEAKEQAGMRVRADSVALHRAKQPHVPFPDDWNDGLLLITGADQTDRYFEFEPNGTIQFARPVLKNNAVLSIKRLQKDFKAAANLLGDTLPDGWTFSTKVDKDNYTTTFTRTEQADEPESLSILAYAEFQGRGRVETVEIPIQWMDPITITLEPPDQLVAGRTNGFTARLNRDGGDPQAVELKLTELPREWKGPDVLSIAADSDEVGFEIEIPGDDSGEIAEIKFDASSKYGGVAFKIAGVVSTPNVLKVPVQLNVYPQQVELVGDKSSRQLVVTGYDEFNSPRDWTRDVLIRSANPEIAEVIGSVVRAKSQGQTELLVEVGEKRTVVPVSVTAIEGKRRTRFESEVLVALSKQGCNSGACHGSPSGKGMFRLSLRAFDRKLDELTLIREDFGRRINRMEPEKSLLLLKPMMKVAHGGGKKLHQDDVAYEILRSWIEQGGQSDPPDAPRCVRLEVYPDQKRILSLDQGGQQIAVLAHFEDGSAADVTDMVSYESSNTSVATVDARGLVTPLGRGESAILVRYLEHIESLPLMFIQKDPDFQWASPNANNYIDDLVNAKLQQLQYLPSETCSDSEFLRRVHLDVVGILPTVQESQAFLEDASPNKRSQLIDRLLERDEYAKFWSLKWGDLLKMTQKSLGQDGVYKYHRWLEDSFRNNVPYDQFASELLSAEGSTFANPAANFYRTAADMNDCVETVSQVFLGARLQCAKCHNHPFERWTQDNYYGLGAFFNRLNRRSTQRPGEMFIWAAAGGEVVQPRTGQEMAPWLPAAGNVQVAEQGDRRDALVQWLIQPENPYFARMEANRIWSQCFARGIVDPIDDFRDSNPPSNGPLLDALAKDFVERGFDRKHLLRTILNSRTYQASYEANDSNREDTKYFSHQRPRMLSAEQLLDAVNHVTGLDQAFANLPNDTKATHLPAPDLVKVDFLQVFGQPERSTVCACERTDQSNLGMAIELFNGVAIHEKLRDPKNRFRQAVAAERSIEATLRDLYLAAICRPPSQVELAAAVEHCRTRENPTEGLEDVCWALLNTDEFLFQH